MPTRRTRGHVSSPHGIIGFVALILAVTAGAALAGSSRSAREPERIFVTAVSGSVSVTMAGSSTPVQLDSTVGLPARIVTGDDGMLTLTQAGTNITIAADSDVEIPPEAADGQLIARLVQRRGNVFYDVAHREAGTLRVETPFLVAVIKGTQFNVAVQDGSSTISLFQGRLEIDTPDGSNSVFINAGQIATRSNLGNSIEVIGMNDVRLEAPRSGNAVARDDAPLQPRVFTAAAGTRDTPAGAVLARVESASLGADFDLGAAASANKGLHVGPGVVPGGLGLSGGVGAGGVPAAIGLNAELGAGGAPSLGANLNVGAGSPGVSLGTSVGVGANLGSASVGGSVNVDVGLGNNGLHLGTGGSVGSNPGLHLGNGNPAPPGKSNGHP